MHSKYFLVFYLLGAFLSANDALKDIKINADNIDYYSEGKRADADGNVVLEHNLNGKKLKLKCNKMHATFNEHGKLLEAKATGNVEIYYNDEILKSESCVHSFLLNKTICEGEHVYLINGLNELRGQKAILDFNTQIFTMQAFNGNHIEATIYRKTKE